MRKQTMLCFFLTAFISQLVAQENFISGKIVNERGDPVPFTTILVKGSKSGTSADAEGRFSIKAKPTDIFLVSGTSINSMQIVVGASTSLTITVQEKSNSLSEVVVTTAFGVKREKKALGYSAQEVKATDLTQANQSNTLSALSGKVAGLQVTNSTGSPGAATFIRLRGITSLGGGEPLIVVDGVPIDNSTMGMSMGNVAQSNRAVDLNPDDIDNVTVLKGPAAASLYGTQGSDGVILINTKRGKKKFELSYGYGVTFDMVNRLPEHQDKFVKGSGGALASSASGTSTSFGPLADTLKWTGTANQWDIHGDIVGASNPLGTMKFLPYDNADQFFRTGITQTHSLGVTGGNENTSYRFSYSNLNQDGIIPSSNFQRNTLRLNADSKLSDKLRTGASVSYVISGGDRIQEGSNTSGLMLGLLRSPISFDNSNGATDPEDPKAYIFPTTGFQRTYRGVGDGIRGYYDNPYWTINQNKFKDHVNRIFGNAYLTYDLSTWLSISDRIGADQYSDNRKQNFAIYSSTFKPGQVVYDDYFFQSVNNDILATLKHKLTHDLSGVLLLGNNFYSETFHHENSTGSTLLIPNFYDLGNSTSQTAFSTSYTLRKKSFFAQAKFDYKNILFVDGTIRAENSSAFVSSEHSKGKWVYFPSVNGSFLFTDALNINKDILSYGKLRISYGQAGRLPSIFSTDTYYAPQNVADGWTSGLTYPINGQQGFFAGSLGNPGLKPEVTSTVDVGTELKFFKGKLSLDFTYYNSKSKDLLLQVPLAPSSGYGSQYKNAASINNHGVEVTISTMPVQNKKFTWDLLLNWSMNRSKVTSLGQGVQTLFLGGFQNGSINAIAGQPFGMIYGIGYVKDQQGNTIINDDPTDAFYGYPIVDANSRAIGNPNPQWIGGIENKFTMGKFRFSFLFDTKQKFDMWNGTRGAMVNFGTAKETETRGHDFTFTGVPGHFDANGNLVKGAGKANIVVQPNQDWYQSGGSGFIVNEPFVEDASFVKLRELALGFTLDFNKGNISKIARSVELTVIGRNLLLFTSYKGVDPETSLGGGTALGIDYFNNPGTRSLGLDVKVNF